MAEFTTTSLAAGTNTITASYGGTASFAASATGTIVTAAGNGTAGYTGNNGPATAAELNLPWGIAFDSAGDLFFADTNNNVVREVVKATGDIITVAGNGTAGYSGDNGPATAAELNSPNGVAVDSAGDLFIADTNNNVIREVVKSTGDIITVRRQRHRRLQRRQRPRHRRRAQQPPRHRLDTAGDLFIADWSNNVIREVVTGDRRHHHRRRQRHRRLQRRQRTRHRRRAQPAHRRRRRLRGRPVHRRRGQQRNPRGGRGDRRHHHRRRQRDRRLHAATTDPPPPPSSTVPYGIAFDTAGDCSSPTQTTT